MRQSLGLLAAVAAAASIAFACGTEVEGVPSGEEPGTDAGGGTPGPGFQNGDDVDGGGGGPSAPQNIASMRIDPPDATLDVVLGQVATKPYKVLAKMKEAPDVEVDITSRAVFYVPSGYLVGTFPADGGPLFSTRLPTTTNTEAQRGGQVTVEAKAASSDGSVTTVTTSLLVRLTAASSFGAGTPEATPVIPANPALAFAGTPSNAHAPTIFYPNAGTMVPPNLKRLEIHFKKGDAADKLFEVSFTSANASLVLYTRCTNTPSGFEADALENDACAIRLEDDVYGALAESNRGLGPVKLRVRGADELGGVGASIEQDIEFAENRVDGGVYYWTASSGTKIMRFDFGSGAGVPESYLVPNQDGLPNACVGCHSLSRDGSKLFAGVGNSSDGRLVFIDNVLTKNLAVNGASAAPANTNRVLLGSFNPDASQFVAVAPKNDAEADTKLMFHDGTTGLRSFTLDLGFVPSHPDWSPDGKSIAVTRIGGSNPTTIEFFGGGIDVIKNAGAWNNSATITDVQVIPPAANKNRYNPTFMPGNEVLLYTEVPCDSGNACNGYSDPGAKTLAVTPTLAATPVPLANVAKPGVADGVATDLMDTFPRATPFETVHRSGKLLWFTVSSQRRAGLRKFFPNPSVVGDPATQQTLWMFAIDPAKVLAGQDGSFTGFFLPFQDMKTSNHMAQWTQKIVSSSPPPPPPPVPPPPPPPPPPPLPK
jgi:hypothetical protein